MRPHYETVDHKHAEREVCRRLEAAWKCRIMGLPVSYRLDAVAIRGNDAEVFSWLEVKCRDGQPDQHETYYLSAAKWNAGLSLATTTAKPFTVVFDWSGAIRYHRVDFGKMQDYPLRWGGRTKRTRDAADIEPMVHIPAGLFKTL